ncbi:AAA family ATPase [Dyadobacter psychrotolerans]|uniref:Endonuclease GajA/Old nuclease/RecF-like AAA domain-containing protein n=1 Tax=Dyadobacter psychrotolerans TaxID=2541721 RepID=A0A4R5DP66_9BACT|nr:AAA family ATPase [Dyadobacter psychrotolerans]TDE13930.1 hypothetical protein E0F88_18795 [Dyadobacter psychrotolerans]
MQTHLKGFGLENFRVFKDYTWFDFAPITILTGPNSSGKSSLNKALMLMKDNLKKDVQFTGKVITRPITDTFSFNYDGEDHNLSSAKNTINLDSESPYISYCLPIDNTFSNNQLFLKINQIVRERVLGIYKDKKDDTVLRFQDYIEILNSNVKKFLALPKSAIYHFIATCHFY